MLKNVLVPSFNFNQPFTVDALCTGQLYDENYPFNFIIGMDIIKRGDFNIDTETKSFSLNFEKTKL